MIFAGLALVLSGLVVVVSTTDIVAGEEEDVIFQDAFEWIAPPPGPVADLQLEKAASLTEVEVEQPFQYILTIDNLGPDPATEVAVSDSLPAGVGFVGVSADSPLDCQHDAGLLSCSAAVLPMGQFVVSIDVTAPSIEGLIVNTATLSAATFDPDPPGPASDSGVLVVPASEPPPMDQPVVAPGPFVPGEVGGIADTAFEWVTGPDAPQSGVAEGALDERRIALMTGRVLDRSGEPISGVTVRMLDVPELGSTVTDAHGFYTFAFNGGGWVVLDFDAPELLRVQRRFTTVWNEWGRLDDVVMIGIDVESHTVAPVPAGGHLHVASTESDGDGTRTARLFLHEGTVATAVLDDDSEIVLDDLTVSVSEYTVGDTGLAAMPGALPPASAYTYAAEVRVAEAEALGAVRVNLSIPASAYLDNFLGFDVGEEVPLGVFDREISAWLARDNARVIAVIGMDDGLALIDITGDGVADDAEALGITQAERAMLASQFPDSSAANPAELWRMVLPHFSPWDPNPPALTENDVVWPPAPDSQHNGDVGTPQPSAPIEPGFGRIVPESRNLIETVPLAGTDLSLVHSADRQAGRKGLIRIPVISGPVPDFLDNATVQINVLGRTLIWHYSTEDLVPDLTAEFVWDGRDVFGRRVDGAHHARVSVVYRYPAELASIPPGAAFGRPGLGGTGVPTRLLLDARAESVITVSAGGLHADGVGLGGWTISGHHRYDPMARTLHYGHGGVRESAASINSYIVEHVAGLEEIEQGTSCGFMDPCGDGGPATEAELRFIREIVVAPDGTIFLAEIDGTRIRRIDAQTGIIETYAGVGSFTDLWTDFEENECVWGKGELCGDGGPANEAYTGALSLAIAPDGALLMADTFTTGRIRRVDPETRIISSVVGYVGDVDVCPATDNCGDGGPATEAGLGMPYFMAVSQDGSIWLDHGASSSVVDRIRRVGPEGLIHTVLGHGRPGHSGTSCTGPVPAEFDLDWFYDCPRVESFSDSPIALSERDSLYFITVGGPPGQALGLLELLPTGELQVRGGFQPAASYGANLPNGDGGLLRDAPLGSGTAINLAPDRSMLLSGPSARVRRVSSDGLVSSVMGYGGVGGSFDRAEVGAFAINTSLRGATIAAAGPDGSIYVVENPGSPTGLRRWRVLRLSPRGEDLSTEEIAFPDANGRLLDVFSQNGRHLRVISALTGTVLREFEYDSAGRLAAVVDHTGPDTTLTTQILRDGAGRPTAIVAPFGEVTELTVDGQGYLSSIMSPDGHSIDLAKTEDGLLAAITGERSDAVTTYSFTYDSLGHLHTATDPDGGVTSLEQSHALNEVLTVMTHPDAGTRSIRVLRRPNGGFRRELTDEAGLVTVQEVQLDGSIQQFYPDGTSTISWRAADPRFGAAASYESERWLMTADEDRPARITTRLREVDLDGNGTLVTLTERRMVDGRETIAVFDAADRTWTTTTPEGRVSVATLDAWHRLEHLDLPGEAPVSWVRDPQGRVVSVIEGEAGQERITSFVHEGGHIVTRTDALGQATQVERDAMGRSLSRTLPDGQVISIERDEHGNLTDITPPGGLSHGQVFDDRDRIAAHIAPGDANTTYSFDTHGALTDVQRANGTELIYTWQDRRPIARSGDALGIAVSFDPVTGQLVQATADAVQSFAHDGLLLERLTVEHSLGNEFDASIEIDYAYDDAFRRISETIGGLSIATEFDDDGFPVLVGEQSISRDPGSAYVTSRSIGDTVVSYTYDDFGALLAITATHDGLPLFSEAILGRDALGRVVERTETINGSTTTWSYGYDLVGRLVAAVETPQGGPSMERNYGYDANGNLVSGPDLAVGVYAADDRLIEYAGRSYDHDLAGDLTTITDGAESIVFNYDAAGLLHSLILPDGSVIAHRHDAADRRVTRLVDDEPVAGWVYGTGASPLLELQADGSVRTRFVYALHPATPDYVIHHDDTLLVVRDHRGTPRMVVDVATGDIMEQMVTDEFGAITSDPSAWTILPLAYRGGMHEPHTGLVRFGARDYDPSIGRFTTRDPILFNGGQANLFLFATGDPVNRHDPSGRGPSNLIDNAGNLAIANDLFEGLPLYDSGHTGNFLSVLDAAGAGWQVGTGIDQIGQGDVIGGSADVVGGGTKLGVGLAAAASSGPALPLAVAGGIMSESIDLAVDSIKAASEGRPTKIDIATDYWGQKLFGLPTQYNW